MTDGAMLGHFHTAVVHYLMHPVHMLVWLQLTIVIHNSKSATTLVCKNKTKWITKHAHENEWDTRECKTRMHARNSENLKRKRRRNKY